MESRQLITSGPLPPSQRRSWVSRPTTLWVVSWAVWMWWTVCLRRNIRNRCVCFSLCMYCVCWGEPHASCMYSPSVCLQWKLHCSITSYTLPISNCVKLIHYHKDRDHSWTYFYSDWGCRMATKTARVLSSVHSICSSLSSTMSIMYTTQQQWWQAQTLS